MKDGASNLPAAVPTKKGMLMKCIVIATALAVLAGCASFTDTSAAQGGSASSWSRQYNSGYPYNPPYN